MDFYGILFDMKNGKKIPYSKNYFDTMFAAKLEELGVKTITGTLPLTFRTSETALRSWTIYGNNYEHKYSASGTLPLAFTTHTAGAASDWAIEGNAEGVGERTENILDVQATDSDKGYVSAAFLKTDNTIQSNNLFMVSEYFPIEPSTTYTLSSIVNYGTSTAICFYDTNKVFISGERLYVGDIETTNVTTPCNAAFYRTTVQISQQVYSSAMIIKGSTAPTTFIPYGYEIPISVSGENLTNPAENISEANINSTGTVTTNVEYKLCLFKVQAGKQYSFRTSDNVKVYALFTTKPRRGASQSYDQTRIVGVTTFTSPITGWCAFRGLMGGSNEIAVEGDTIPETYIPYFHNDYAFYIDSPLTAGQSISKTSTGVDIAAVAGSNTISTDLYNKPSMSIEGVDYVGVGRPRGQDWEIRLVCVGELSPYKPNAPESDTSYVYNATDYTLDTDSRYKTALIDIGEGRQKIFTIGKTKGETFTIQPLDYMAEWGGVDHYNQIGQTITPTEETYTG
ncbi:MAG: hypothetical protein II574_06755, partial [Ruminococcus sp.]|nr:hypothetical protein [Ruminococcus sp.]